jgi:hypothetical protein
MLSKKWGELSGQAPATRKRPQPDPTFVMPSCLIGLEFEFEKVASGVDAVHEAYAAHPDGSLRGGGMEFSFRAPLFGNALREAVDHMCKHSAAHAWDCSHRAGLHVHVDARDMTPAQLKSMGYIYAGLEPFLYQYIGEGRDCSNFCLPWYAVPDSAGSAFRMLARLEADPANPRLALDRAQRALGDKRYTGLNYAALAKYGSVEFRQMRVTNNYDRVISWINMCMSLKKFAMNVGFGGQETLEFLSKTGPRRSLVEVFGEPLAAQIRVKCARPDQLQMEGFQTIMQLMTEDRSD